MMKMKRAEIVKEYKQMQIVDAVLQKCASCNRFANKHELERHHPAGRKSTNMLRYVYLCHECHEEVHHDPKKATERGLLWRRRNTHDITAAEWGALLLDIENNKYI
jgi:hypothetical protein